MPSHARGSTANRPPLPPPSLLPPPPPPSLPPPLPPKPPLPPRAAAPLTNLAARFGQARAAAAARVIFCRGGRATIRGRRLERVSARNRARVDRVVLGVLAVVGRHPQSGSTSGGVPTTVQIRACRPPHTPRPPRRRAGAVSYSRPFRRPERRTNPKFLRLPPPPPRRRPPSWRYWRPSSRSGPLSAHAVRRES